MKGEKVCSQEWVPLGSASGPLVYSTLCLEKGYGFNRGSCRRNPEGNFTKRENTSDFLRGLCVRSVVILSGGLSTVPYKKGITPKYLRGESVSDQW